MTEQRPSGVGVGASTGRGDGLTGAPCEVMVPMRDGCRLATDVYGPEDLLQGAVGCDPSKACGPRPVILERTPYGKRTARDSDQSRHDRTTPTPEESSEYFVARGYVVVRQDCRGRGRSEGEFVKYLNEGPDGADTLEWLIAQPWCDGRVVMNGVSYSAHAQTAAAAESPRALAAMFLDSGGFSSAYEVGSRMGGAFELKQATWAFRHAVRSQKAAQDPVLAAGLAATNIADWFTATPWRRGCSPLQHVPDYEDYLLDQWAAEDFGEFWRQPALYARGHYERFPDVPSFHISSWYDPYVRSTVENFSSLRALKSAPAYLLLGPWTHGKRCLSYAGDVDFGPAAFFDGNLAESYLSFRADWFDDVLADGVSSRPAVTYFLMGGGSGARTAQGRLDHGGQWLTDEQWPPSGTFAHQVPLGADRRLGEQPISGEISYAYDPEHPVPSLGGQITSGGPVMRGGAYDQVTGPAVYGAQSPYLPLSARADVVVFRSEPLTESVAIAGPVSAILCVSSDAPDTDITVKLIDEYPPSESYPNGFAMNLTDGILRLRYRESFESPQLMFPGEIYRVKVELPDVANLFAAGHRIRLDVSSSNFPRFDINHNTGEKVSAERVSRTAVNTLHFSAEHPASLELHVLSRE